MRRDEAAVDYGNYRVIRRSQALVIVALIAAAGAALLWFTLQWMGETSERATLLMSSSPERAAEELATQLRVVGAVNGFVFGAASLYLAWFAWRGVKTASIPPIGAWVIEGRQIKTGPKAVRLGYVLLGAAAVLLALTAGVSIAALRIAALVEDGPARNLRMDERTLGALDPPAGQDAARYHGPGNAGRQSRPTTIRRTTA